MNKINSRFKPRMLRSPAGEGEGGAAAGGAPTTATAATTSNDSAAATVTMGDAAKVSQEGNSASASSPSIAQNDPALQNQPDFKTSLGDYAKDPMFADIKDAQSLAKMYQDTKKLVGQKLGIPGADATPEAKAAFHEAMGVPKEPAGYNFKEPEGIPDAIKDVLFSKESTDKWAKRCHELGIPASAAEALRNDYIEDAKADIGKLVSDAETSDAEFAKLSTKAFGSEQAASTALANAKTLIEKHAPPEIKEGLKNLPNSALLAIATTINGELKALQGEDRTITRTDSTTSEGKTVGQLRDEAKEIMKDPAYNDPTVKGMEEHKRLRKQVTDIYTQADLKSRSS